jgi:hypothetical protein
MPGALDERFTRRTDPKRLLLGIYLIPGFPSWEASKDAVELAQSMGVGFIEFPIVGAGRWSPRTGTSIGQALTQHREELSRMSASMRSWLRSVRVGVGVVYDGVWIEPRRWCAPATFLRRSRALILEPNVNDWDAYAAQAEKWGKPLIPTVDARQPMSSADERRVRATSHGFIYMSLGAKTGERTCGLTEMRATVMSLRTFGTSLPVCAAFGIQAPADVAQVRAAGCDGVIVGSAAIDALEHGVESFARWLDTILDACGKGPAARLPRAGHLGPHGTDY